MVEFRTRFEELDTLNALIQKINSTKPKGTLKPNYSIPKSAAKRVIRAGLIAIDSSPVIPADRRNYPETFFYFCRQDYIHKNLPPLDLMWRFKNSFVNDSPSIEEIIKQWPAGRIQAHSGEGEDK